MFSILKFPTTRSASQSVPRSPGGSKTFNSWTLGQEQPFWTVLLATTMARKTSPSKTPYLRASHLVMDLDWDILDQYGLETRVLEFCSTSPKIFSPRIVGDVLYLPFNYRHLPPRTSLCPINQPPLEVLKSLTILSRSRRNGRGGTRLYRSLFSYTNKPVVNPFLSTPEVQYYFCSSHTITFPVNACH